jgi:hypothetical protein
MSDTQQGPGWWMASDGKWYPPQGEQLPPPPPPAFPQYVNPTVNFSQRTELVSNTLVVWLQALLYIAAGLVGISALVIPTAVSAAEKFMNSSMGSALEMDALNDWVSAEDGHTTFFGLYTLVGIPVFILLIIFSFRAYKSTQSLWAGPRKWSRGWTVGGWFIPLANFIIVPKVLIETDRIASAPRNGGQVSDGWQRLSANSMLIWWWALYGIGALMNYGITYANSENASSFDDYKIGMYIGMVGELMVVASCVLAALTVRRMGKALSPSSMGA